MARLPNESKTGFCSLRNVAQPPLSQTFTNELRDLFEMSTGPQGQRLDRSSWVDAGQQTRQLIDQVGGKHESVARQLGWSKSKLSKTLNGARIPTEEDLVELDELLSVQLEIDSYQPGDINQTWTNGFDELDDGPNPDPLSSVTKARRPWALAGAAVGVLGILAVGAFFYLNDGDQTGQASGSDESIPPPPSAPSLVQELSTGTVECQLVVESIPVASDKYRPLETDECDPLLVTVFEQQPLSEAPIPWQNDISMCQVADRPGIEMWLRIDSPINAWLPLDRNDFYRATLDQATYQVLVGTDQQTEVDNGQINDRITEVAILVDPSRMDPQNNWLGKCENHFITPGGIEKHGEMNFNWEPAQ